MNTTFEDFLKERHVEDYHGTDDDMPEAFDSWLCDLGADDWIELGNNYGDIRAFGKVVNS